MALISNPISSEVAGGGIKLYSGLSNVNVIAVNPTLEELHALDIKVKSEPNYTISMGDQEYNKVVFWVKNDKGNFKLEILMQPKHRVSQSGKSQWMNSIGQSTWSEDEPSYDWWKSEGQRKAYVGEETLINFAKCWANVANGDEVSFDTIAKIAAGDVTELKAYVTALAENPVRVLIGVKDDKYQVIYTKYFGRAYKTPRDTYFVKSLNDDYGSFNADFNADLLFDEHKSTASLVTPDAVSEDEDWTMPDTPLNKPDEKEEMPF